MGGDGTLNEVINGIAGTPARLGIIPTGLSNVLARELGITQDLGEAAETVRNGRVRRIDLGMVNGRYFSLMVSVGLDAQAVKIVNRTLKRYLKRYAYHLAGLKAAFTFHPPPFEITVDGEIKLSARAAVISSSRFYGGPHQITPQARIDDGILHCCFFEKAGLADYLRYYWGVLRKSHHTFSDVAILTGRTVSIDQAGLPLQADGDYIGTSPVQIEITPRFLPVQVPNNIE